MSSPTFGRNHRVLRQLVVASGIALLARGGADAQVQSVLNPPGAAHLESISAGGRNSPVFGDPAYFWFQRGRCVNTGETPGLPNSPAYISRIAAYLSPVRRLVTREQSTTCSPDIYNVYSNLAVDGQFLWFLDSRFPGFVALERLSRDANPVAPDFAELDALGSFGHTPPHEVEVSDADVYYVFRTDTAHTLYRISKTGDFGARTEIFSVPAHVGIFDLQWDGIYLWFRVDTEPSLLAYEPANGNILPAGSPVTAYLAEASFEEPVQSGGIRRYTFITIAEENVIYSGDLQIGNLPVFYTSPVAGARIYQITTDRRSLFWFESRPMPGSLSRTHFLFRRALEGGPVSVVPGVGGVRTFDYQDLATDESFVYWVDPLVQDLFRTPVDAGTPLVNLRVTGLDVVQGVQNGPGDVPLVAGKRTFVRLYAEADGADVPDVQARLVIFRNGQQQFVLSPSVGAAAAGGPSTRITVKDEPRRFSLADSFTFELPDDATQQGVIAITGTVNPLGSVLEPGGSPLADNSITRSGVEFGASPRLPLVLVNYEYAFGGTLVQVAAADVESSLTYIRRTYPLASRPGDLQDGSAGLRVRQFTVRDDMLAARVARTHSDCDAFEGADKDTCAGFYAVARTRALAAAGTILNLPFAYTYSNIPQVAGGNLFTRGFALSPQELVGPIGPGSDDTFLTYAAHEIGHALGRAHPAAGIGCGHSASDTAYPYVSSFFAKFESPDTLQYYALDSGDPSATLPFSVLTWDQRYDFMSYCSPRWISDYTFRGMLARLTGQGSGASFGLRGVGAAVTGDWLFVAGFVGPDEVALSLIERLPLVADVTSIEPGDYLLELFDSGGTRLSSTSFAPLPSEDGPNGGGGFSFVVPFEPETAEIRVVEATSGAVRASRSVSRGVPIVDDVRLLAAPDPVRGAVTVEWDAHDPDGDPLRFDVLFARDGEAYRPLHLGARGTSVDLDTADLPGGPGHFRVVASDGVNTGRADGATVQVEVKAPRPRILSPGDGTVVAWGAVLTLEGEAPDAQDGAVDPDSLNWSNQYGPLGTGPRLSVMDLPIGANAITLTATNSNGLAAAASIEVVVVDELGPTAPTLAVDPGALGFHVASSAAGVEQQELRIGNLGGGILRFTARTDGTPWLRIDGQAESTANAPRSLVVSADPTGLAGGTIYTASITVTPTGQAHNARSIPVTLSIGNVRDTGGFGLLRGDANCDGRVTAADVTALLRNIAAAERSPCGEDDVNADLQLDLIDVELIPAMMFRGR